MRIGIDVGGTNTDAALMKGQQVLASAKTHTTADVTSGVVDVIKQVLSDSKVSPQEIKAVMVGTTHFVNAFVQRRELLEVACVRIALPMGTGIPPLVDWPEDLRQCVGEHIYMVEGGSYYTGQDYIGLDVDALQQVAKDIQAKNLRAVAITSVFAPIRPDLEETAAEIIKQQVPSVEVTLSHQVGGIGLIERENAAIINASLQGLSRHVVSSLRQVMTEMKLKAQLYISHNDGTLMNADYAEQYPVMTCSAGPTNSIRGAAFLTGLKDALVVDIGGTTTDVGCLLKGFPRETTEASELGGVRTNFSMPDVLSIALGGGTHVKFNDGKVQLGPESVGYKLLQEGRAFGGDTLTTSDIAIACGRMSIGDATLLSDISAEQKQLAQAAISERVASAIDQVKTNAAAVPVVLVGGGSVLLDGDLLGATEILKPEHASVANAIGAAIAQVGGRVKRIYDYGVDGGREAVLKLAEQEARDNAINAGADPETLELVDIEEYPMTHMQTKAVDVRIRVVGQLANK